MTPWDYPDFDDHEGVHLFRDPAGHLTAIIAIHSTALGPAGGGVRYWSYADKQQAITDALRLSRGMSYKNAMAGLPMGGGKGVILADPGRPKDAALLQAFGRAIDSLGGNYVTAQDVGMSEQDIRAIAETTSYVSGLPASAGAAGGSPGPSTAYGVYLGIKAAVQEGLGRDSLKGVHVALQGVGAVGGGTARRLAAEGARLTLADVDSTRARSLADELGAEVVDTAAILATPADILSPNALGAILDSETIAQVQAPVIAGGANNQLATPQDAQRLHARGILYAPDYVINAGGIINVALEYLGQGNREEVNRRIEQIPDRLRAIWQESKANDRPAADVADAMAQKLIGR